jgi:glycosyltransferase involved in cell wall biosynthesis
MPGVVAMQSEKKPDVIILGYDKRRIASGVTAATDILLENLPNVRLHPLKHCYEPATDAWLYFVSLFRFVGILIGRRKNVLVQAIVGSRGDRVRAVPVLLTCALLRVPVCVQYHKDVQGLVFRYGSLFDRFLDQIYKISDLHVFLSASLRSEFLAMAPEIKKTTVINNALSNTWMGLSVTPIEDRDIDIVFFGRWNAEKGIDVLLEYLDSTAKHVRCEIYSDSVPDRDIKHTLVRPWAGEAQVRSVLGRSRLLVLPSYSEAYPIVLLEALACGTPFVATNVGGVPDIARESEGGVLVEPGNASALGSAIETLLADRTRWSEHSKLGWEWVNRTCTVKRVLPLWQDVYASLQDRHSAS